MQALSWIVVGGLVSWACSTVRDCGRTNYLPDLGKVRTTLFVRSKLVGFFQPSPDLIGRWRYGDSDSHG